MNQNDDNSTPISNEALLRFLDSPQRRALDGNVMSVRGDAPPPGANAEEGQNGEEGSEINHRSVCGTAGEYLSLALGNIDSDKAEALLEHTATCDPCGQMLANSLHALEGNPSPEETEAIATLAAARPEFQRKLARDLAATPVRKHSRWSGFSIAPNRFFGDSDPNRRRGWRLAAGAAAAVLVAAVVLFVWNERANSPERKLAQAYSQARTLELRIPDAAYAASVPGNHTRGDSADREPPALLEARAQLARKLEKSPQNPHWLQLQARADILAEHYDSATDLLDRLLATGPVTAELLVDAASAYFQRGLVSANQLDRSTALDYLRRADELSPADPVVLFNEAIVMEDRGQLMNAVEVWNRYITVERDGQWAAEGKRKLSVLEQTLNRLKTHDSRIQQMLSSPAEVDALASDSARVASLDEELSSTKLEELLTAAYPIPHENELARPGTGKDQARGSPCDARCAASRKLLKNISISLERHHHDFWLSDLMAPEFDSLPQPVAALYANALQLLGKAVNEGIVGDSQIAAQQASQASALFAEISASAHSIPLLSTAANVGYRRAAVEHLFTLQRLADFRGCRFFAEQLAQLPASSLDLKRYPWMEAVRMVTEKNCEDTPETREAGRELLRHALQLAETNRYALLKARIEMRATADADLTGDVETLEKLTLAVLHDLAALDVPAFRMVNTVNPICFAEQDSPRPHMAESCFRELEAWVQLSGNRELIALTHMQLARADIRIGAMQDFNRQLKLAYSVAAPAEGGATVHFEQSELMIAQAMLQRGDLEDARSFLDRAAPALTRESDSLAQRNYAAARGQLELSLAHYDKASTLLISEIRASEGRNVAGKDKAFLAEYAAEDHDLYAELAAVWLAQGRSPSSVLALWERFRLRSHGLAIRPCSGNSLDCEQPDLAAAQQKLVDGMLIGQIVLSDRVLIYRANSTGVAWLQKTQRREDLLDAAHRLERAVSSPVTTQATANELAGTLADALLPPLPTSLAPTAFLFLEPDPLVENLSWPVLPVATGPLGIAYPLAEVRTLLAPVQDGPSGAAGTIDRKEQAGSPLVIAASFAGDGMPLLPETLLEADEIKRYLRAPRLLLGREATASDVASELGSATVWHFAGHARQSGSGTELLLAPGPSISKPWIDGAFLRSHPPQRCRLAVLSACATGRLEAAWNHPLQDIVATLGSLGVPEVVATRWQIDSEATVPFMDNFYRSLAKGDSVAMALSNARRVQSGNSLYKNPYYWGAYYLSGRETQFDKGKLYANFEQKHQSRPETAQAGLKH